MRSTTVVAILILSLSIGGGCQTGRAPVPQTIEVAPADTIAAPPTQPFFADAPRWRGIYQGLDFAELRTDKPRELVVQILRVDTGAEGLELVTTPGNGEKPLETDGQTTRAFLEQYGLAVAINTHFFDPCCNLLPGEAKDLIGLSIAQREVVSPASQSGQRDAIYFARDQNGDGSALRVIPVPATSMMHFFGDIAITHAIAGRMILIGGTPFGGEEGFSAELHPRTLVGVGDANRLIYLVTIDGRQPGYSTGASLDEAAAIMHDIGASMALNVDGGGSTTMVIRDPDGASQLANRPSHGFERVVGSNLGFRARPLQPPELPIR